MYKEQSCPDCSGQGEHVLVAISLLYFLVKYDPKRVECQLNTRIHNTR